MAFYSAVGYEVIGSVAETGIGHLTMLKLPDDPFVTIELVSQSPDESPDRPAAPSRVGSGLSHLVIAVPSMQSTVARLAAAGIEAEPPTSPDGSDDFQTTTIIDPDANRIELVQWPTGHPDGMTSADFGQKRV